MKAVCILSGGIDSTTLLYRMLKEGFEVLPISFFYGQKHSKELKMASLTCAKLNLKHKIIDLSSMSDLLKSALTTKDIAVPEGHYQAENMKQTVVPNRNMIFLSISAGIAYSTGAKIIGIGVHTGDHAIYPDCRESFIQDFERLVNKGNEWFDELRIYAPYINKNKIDIVKDGLSIGVDYSLTWTCYKGGEKACGKCGSCIERLEAFNKNNAQDPLEYES